jgi:hypothetical protein
MWVNCISVSRQNKEILATGSSGSSGHPQAQAREIAEVVRPFDFVIDLSSDSSDRVNAFHFFSTCKIR